MTKHRILVHMENGTYLTTWIEIDSNVTSVSDILAHAFKLEYFIDASILYKNTAVKIQYVTTKEN